MIILTTMMMTMIRMTMNLDSGGKSPLGMMMTMIRVTMNLDSGGGSSGDL